VVPIGQAKNLLASSFVPEALRLRDLHVCGGFGEAHPNILLDVKCHPDRRGYIFSSSQERVLGFDELVPIVDLFIGCVPAHSL